MSNRQQNAGGAAIALAFGILSTTTASSQVVAGWDSWSSGGAPDATVLLPDVTATAATTGGWTNNEQGGSGRGSSDDGTWGTYGQDVIASTVSTGEGANLALTNGKVTGELTFTIVNGGTTDLDLNAFHMDAVAFRRNAARKYTLNVLAGSDITEGLVFESESPLNNNSTNAVTQLEGSTGLTSNDNHDDIDIDLTGLADSTLEAGGTAIIQIVFSEGTGSGAGHHLFLDNVAVTAVSSVTDKLAVTSVPAAATAGVDFPITVEAQDSDGNPLAVTNDTEITLVSSGAGTLTGLTGTIAAGTSSITFNNVQGTVAETIAVSALRTSGDTLLSSEPSSTFTIMPAAASAFAIETAADGSGETVGDTTVLIGFDLDVFAITRDSFGNFVANDSLAVFTLPTFDGGVLADDLVDNEDGSANFVAGAEGTATIRASLTGLPDADTGLITTRPLVNRYDGGTNSSPNWSTAIVWEGDVLPTDSNETDLFFLENPGITKRSSYLGKDYLVRSISFDRDSGGSFTTSFVLQGNTTPANLTFDTDSETEPAEFNVALDVLDPITFGRAGFVVEGDEGNMILADDLRVNQDGFGDLTFNSDIVESGGSHGLTKVGGGKLILLGNNTYTGDTTVDGGILQVNGTSISDSGTLVITNNGMVEVIADERVAGLVIDGVAQPDGVYGSSESTAENVDDLAFLGAATITVGPPPVVEPIVIDSIAVTGADEVTLTFTSTTNVDVYESNGANGFVWSLLASDQASDSSFVDDGATEDKNFYVLVPTGAPAPADAQ